MRNCSKKRGHSKSNNPLQNTLRTVEDYEEDG